MKWDSVVYITFGFGNDAILGRRVKKGMTKGQALKENRRARRFVVKNSGIGIYTVFSAIVGGGKHFRHCQQYPVSKALDCRCRCVSIPVTGLGGLHD